MNVLVGMAWSIGSFSCSEASGGSPEAVRPDGGDVDAGDALTPHEWDLDLCAPAGSSCTEAADCAPSSKPPSNCTACVPYNAALCVSGECLAPPLVPPEAPHTVLFQVSPELRSGVKSFVGTVVDRRSSAGRALSCVDLTATGSPSPLESRCANILDTRVLSTIARVEDAYAMTFSRFPAGREVLFSIRGYGLEGGEGPVVGLSCTEVQICTACSDEPQRIAGTMMTRP